jgi:hypothetical protein
MTGHLFSHVIRHVEIWAIISIAVKLQSNDQDDNVLHGEDDRSIERHLDDINTELAKLRPDFAVIKEKIKATLVTRSKIVEEPLNTVLEKFPWLTNPKLVKLLLW